MGFKPYPKLNEESVIDLGTLNPKQKQFCQARSLYVGYGGARGGGKTHVSRVKAIGGALNIPNLRILFVRHEYPELEQTVILPMQKMIPKEAATYNGSLRMFFFPNGSVIKFGHFSGNEAKEYQGQEWDWIFMDEATQFAEEEFLILNACLRGATDVPRRMYLTCNPGGVGHFWVKRLFIDRDYNKDENPEDYTFIQATVDDNPQLKKSSPAYLKQLDRLPPDIRRAWRYGDWDAMAGNFFPEFRPQTHIEKPLTTIPRGWRLYRAFDYGLDMLACLWVAIDYQGNAHVYREVQMPDLIVSKAANLILSLTPPSERIEANIAPPDLKSRQKDTGRTMAEVFADNGLPLIFADNNRIAGWMAVKEWLKPRSDKVDDEGNPDLPRMMVSSECVSLVRNLAAIQHDKKNPSDCATEPHIITHICDALRYFCVTRTLEGERPVEQEDEDEFQGPLSYEDAMTGGELTTSYLSY